MQDSKSAAAKHGQRFGQFVSNAMKEYLLAQNRDCGDFEVGQSLFFISNEELDTILDSYSRLLDARMPLGFGSRVGDAVSSDNSNS